MSVTTMAKDQRAQLRYFQWSPEFYKTKPYELLLDNIPDDFPVTNFETSPEEAEVIQDLRGMEQSFTLEDHGFCIAKQRLDIPVFDQDTIEKVYLPQVERLLKGMMPDIQDLFIFDWRLRSSDRKLIGAQFEGDYLNLADQTNRLFPAEAVHIVAADHVRRDYNGESYYPLYIPGYKWYYLSGQMEHEVTVFKTYDSRPAGSAKVAYIKHTAVLS
ncbi:uncharacterized protein N7503_003266 [Penicillium pulvis]|uniref:uncharacterized protein n=1 Tax=Penicillium pulvis TaxID=1562058 RepID=UPI002546E602|nr:uncharacterized protein N7503_003266 [Penicillium pulvis]KAJ5805664.1 hypothetical protein N7503_003266 [Penicillium pulvis]